MVGLSSLTGNQEISIVIKAVDKFSTSFKKLNSEIKSTRQTIDSNFNEIARVSKMAGIALTAFGVAGVFALKSMVDEAARFEQTQVAFTTMLGSAEAAQKTLKELTAFAARTPFTLPGVEQAAKQLLAVGFESEDLLPTLKSVGDLAAGLGLGEVGLSRLILNLGQVRAQGKLTGRELRDFAVAGIPLLEELAKEFEVSTKDMQAMVSAGEILEKDVTKVFKKMTSAGGKFANLMTKQSKTTAGRISNLKDEFTLLWRELGQELLPVANDIINVLAGLTSWFGDLSPEVKKTIVFVGLAATAFALLAAPILLFIGLLPTLITGFGAIAAGIALIGGPIAAVLIGLGAIAAAAGLLTLGTHAAEMGKTAAAYDNFNTTTEDTPGRLRDLRDAMGWMERGTRITEPVIKGLENLNIEFKAINGTMEAFITNNEKINEILGKEEVRQATPEEVHELFGLATRARALQREGEVLPQEDLERFNELRALYAGDPPKVGFLEGIRQSIVSIFTSPESDVKLATESYNTMIEKLKSGNITIKDVGNRMNQNWGNNMVGMTNSTAEQVTNINSSLDEIPSEIITTHRIITVWGAG